MPRKNRPLRRRTRPLPPADRVNENYIRNHWPHLSDRPDRNAD